MNKDENVLIVRFYSTDEDSHAALDYFLTRKPEGNLIVYFDDKKIIEELGHDGPDHFPLEHKNEN